MMKIDNCKNEILAKILPNIKTNRLKVGIELLDAILSVDANDKPALLARGSIYLKLKDAKRASRDFSRVLKIDPKNPKAYFLRGLSMEIEDNFSRALKDFNRAIDIDPNYRIAYDSRESLVTRKGLDTKTAKEM